MMREVREIVRLVRKINHKLEISGNKNYQVDETVKKIINTIENEFTEDEKVTFFIFFLKELSFKKTLEHPEFMIRQNNVFLRSMFFAAGLVTFIVILTALLFSDGPFVEGTLNLIKHVHQLFTMGRS